jgi:hypothetical protein
MSIATYSELELRELLQAIETVVDCQLEPWEREGKPLLTKVITLSTNLSDAEQVLHTAIKGEQNGRNETNKTSLSQP